MPNTHRPEVLYQKGKTKSSAPSFALISAALQGPSLHTGSLCLMRVAGAQPVCETSPGLPTQRGFIFNLSRAENSQRLWSGRAAGAARGETPGWSSCDRTAAQNPLLHPTQNPPSRSKGPDLLQNPSSLQQPGCNSPVNSRGHGTLGPSTRDAPAHGSNAGLVSPAAHKKINSFKCKSERIN